MKRRSSKLYLTFLALCGCLLLGSCSGRNMLEEDSDDPREPQAWNINPMVVLHINTLGEGLQSSGVQERIKSLRVIMIHEDPADNKRYIEANRLIEIQNVEAGRFSYFFQKRTVVGKKSFYLIANEESVPSVSLATGSFPAEMGQQPSLTRFLNAYDPAMPTDDEEDAAAAAAAAAQAQEFEQLLGALCFAPMEQSYDRQENVIYLPYSAYYHSGFDIEETADYEVDLTDRPMYLVPVATKFWFRFINEREEAVAIDYLRLESTNRTNYLMAKFDLTGMGNNKELFMTVAGSSEKLYWIDWLKLVANATDDNQSSDDNNTENRRFGWISRYEVPKSGAEDEMLYDFVSAAGPWKILYDSEPQTFGPFYLPEGHHQVSADAENSDAQQLVEQYNLHIKMRTWSEPGAEEINVKEATTHLSNLEFLFRNTCAWITITMREGGVRIYGEIADWQPNKFFGYVQDEDDIKKK